ncbi:unnamed protein product [Cochlearia groenlandica]
MVIKRTKVLEIATDLCESKKKKKKTKGNKRKRLSKEEEEEDDGSPIVGIFCLKTRQDMKIFEEKEDCFILDFDPDDSFEAKKICFSDKSECDDEVEIVHEKGQVACRDFPHPRHLCYKFHFESTNHSTHCNQCYCYVCELAAPCKQWTLHCEAKDNSNWNFVRGYNRQAVMKK